MYHLKGRVRYSEVDENRRLTVDGLINYLQDCSSFHSEDLGIGLDYIAENRIAWVLSGWQIEIKKMPVYGQRIDVQTWPYTFAGFLGERNFRIVDEAGSVLVQADSRWALVNTENGRPTRIPSSLAGAYEMGESLGLKKPPRKLRPDLARAKAMEPFAVQQKHLDTNHHVNNGQYVLMAQEYLPEGQTVSQIAVEYKTPAVLGDTIYPYILEDGGELLVALCTEEKRPYAVVILR